MKRTTCTACHCRLNKSNRKNDILCIPCFDAEEAQWNPKQHFGVEYYLEHASIIDDPSRLEQLENLLKQTGRRNDNAEEAE